jgi:hypothetical protein
MNKRGKDKADGKRLPPEAWHVVQQKQARVKPTAQIRGNADNTDAVLETVADFMGTAAIQTANRRGPR